MMSILISSIILVLKTLGLAFVITHFAPLEWLLTSFKPKNIIINLIYNIIKLLLSCLSCCSFWLGICIGGFWVGVISYIIAFFYQKRFGWLEIEKIKFN